VPRACADRARRDDDASTDRRRRALQRTTACFPVPTCGLPDGREHVLNRLRQSQKEDRSGVSTKDSTRTRSAEGRFGCSQTWERRDSLPRFFSSASANADGRDEPNKPCAASRRDFGSPRPAPLPRGRSTGRAVSRTTAVNAAEKVHGLPFTAEPLPRHPGPRWFDDPRRRHAARYERSGDSVRAATRGLLGRSAPRITRFAAIGSTCPTPATGVLDVRDFVPVRGNGSARDPRRALDSCTNAKGGRAFYEGSMNRGEQSVRRDSERGRSDFFDANLCCVLAARSAHRSVPGDLSSGCAWRREVAPFVDVGPRVQRRSAALPFEAPHVVRPVDWLGRISSGIHAGGGVTWIWVTDPRGSAGVFTGRTTLADLPNEGSETSDRVANLLEPARLVSVFLDHPPGGFSLASSRFARLGAPASRRTRPHDDDRSAARSNRNGPAAYSADCVGCGGPRVLFAGTTSPSNFPFTARLDAAAIVSGPLQHAARHRPVPLLI